MKKILFGIFAHPDDEAFGPSGTLLLETQAGTELHLITLTAGENGTNPDNHQNLGEVRLNEWHKAGLLIGATTMHHFGYEDGMLNNIDHVEAAVRIKTLIRDTIAGREDIEVDLMSIDINGTTGHIDHIVASRSAHLAFYRLKKSGVPVRHLRLVCISNEQLPSNNTDFVFMEAGRPTSQIDEIIDARHLRPQIEAIIRAHHTQRTDGETHIKNRGDSIGLDHFIVKS